MSTLRDKQVEFARALPALINRAFELGYEVTIGDAYRDQRIFGAMGESKGYGAKNSKHKQRLAIDLNLFKDGKLLVATEDHAQLGCFWEAQGGIWGGRFNDGNHYEWWIDY
jgi:hypothetical protein